MWTQRFFMFGGPFDIFLKYFSLTMISLYTHIYVKHIKKLKIPAINDYSESLWFVTKLRFICSSPQNHPWTWRYWTWPHWGRANCKPLYSTFFGVLWGVAHPSEGSSTGSDQLYKPLELSKTMKENLFVNEIVLHLWRICFWRMHDRMNPGNQLMQLMKLAFSTHIVVQGFVSLPAANVL